jgi:hypothetical protein
VGQGSVFGIAGEQVEKVLMVGLKGLGGHRLGFGGFVVGGRGKGDDSDDSDAIQLGQGVSLSLPRDDSDDIG